MGGEGNWCWVTEFQKFKILVMKLWSNKKCSAKFLVEDMVRRRRRFLGWVLRVLGGKFGLDSCRPSVSLSFKSLLTEPSFSKLYKLYTTSRLTVLHNILEKLPPKLYLKLHFWVLNSHNACMSLQYLKWTYPLLIPLKTNNKLHFITFNYTFDYTLLLELWFYFCV